MRYAYYAKLKKAQKATYRQSDAIDTIALRRPRSMRRLVRRLARNLENEQRAALELDARELCNALCADIGTKPVRLRVLAVRPSDDWGELHGLYQPADGRRRARITLWMRTARYKRVVAFRTFLRTLLHEMCHHFDYEAFELDDSFHTVGFFKRESSLFKQLVDDAPQRDSRKPVC